MTCHIDKCRNNTENTQKFYYSCIQVTLNSSPAHNNHTIVLWMTYFRLTASASMLVSVSRILHVARLLFCTATCRAEKKNNQPHVILWVSHWSHVCVLTVAFCNTLSTSGSQETDRIC